MKSAVALLRLIALISAATLTSGCLITDTARHERQRSRETTTLSGTVAGMPVELRTQTTRDALTHSDEHQTATLPALDALGEIIPNALAPLAHSAQAAIAPIAAAFNSGNSNGSLLGGLAGALGAGTTALAWWRGRRRQRRDAHAHEQSLARIVTGIERAKTTLPAASIDALHNALSKSLDTADKARIRHLKAL